MAKQENRQLIEEYWGSFVDSLSGAVEDLPHKYQAWSFGSTPEMADRLGKLVVDGIKTATASLAWSYEQEAEPYPEAGDYSVVLDSEGRPLGIIQTVAVEVVPFNEVDEDQAYQEGEGDRSLAFWREVHWKFFAAECEILGKEPNGEMPVVCEKFELAFIDQESHA